jgi:hypothetical protein
MIGDYDPEDGYDESDPPAAKLKVLEAVVAELVAGDPADGRRALRIIQALALVVALDDVLSELGDRLEAIRQALEDL